MEVRKGLIKFISSYKIVEINLYLGCKVYIDKKVKVRGVSEWTLDEETASAAKRALINILAGKKKRMCYVELEDEDVPDADFYVPGLSYGEFDITINGEKCLHVNRLMSWLYDHKFDHSITLDILRANKNKEVVDEDS